MSFLIRRISPYRGHQIFFDRPGKKHSNTPPDLKKTNGQLPEVQLLIAQAIHLDKAELAPTRDTLFTLLEEQTYEIPDIRRIATAFEHFQNIDTNQQEKNIRVALLLVEFEAQAPAIMAALLMGTKIPSELKDERLTDILENKDHLAQLKAPVLTRKNNDRWLVLPQQVTLFADLLFLKCKKFESILLLAAEDLIDLEHFANEPKNQKNHNKINRAFLATAQILRNFGFGLHASKLEDAALLLGSPTIRKIFAGALKSIKEKGVSFSPLELHYKQRIEGLNRLKEVMAFVKKELIRKNPAKDKQAFKVEIKGRRKGIVSGDQKESDTPDMFAMRAIELTNNEGNCYLILSRLKILFLKGRKKFGEEWKEIEGKYDDWIDNKKENGYQSIHLYFREKGGFVVEIQIRTKEMDKTAEHGTAAHCLHKRGEAAPGKDYQSVIQMARDTFLQKKGDLLMNKGATIVYDANGNLIELITDDRRTRPNLIDFAFKRGIDDGQRVKSGSINGKMVRLDTHLETGQTINVKTFKTPKKRNIAQVNTPYARALLRARANKMFQLPKDHRESRLVELGKAAFERIKESMAETFSAYMGESATRPSLLFPDELLPASLSYKNLREVYITLALLKKTNSFENSIRSLFLQNLVIASQRPSRKRLTLEFLVLNKDGYFSAILETIRGIDIPNYGLYMFDFTAEAVPNTTYSRITLKFNIREGSEEVEDVVKHLELERPYSKDVQHRGYFQTRNAQITLVKKSNLLNTMTDILEVLKKSRINILAGSIASRGTNGNQERILSFDLEIPRARDQRRAHRILVGQVEGINGVKGFRSSAAPR